jgi:hypothetical protein
VYFEEDGCNIRVGSRLAHVFLYYRDHFEVLAAHHVTARALFDRCCGQSISLNQGRSSEVFWKDKNSCKLVSTLIKPKGFGVCLLTVEL